MNLRILGLALLACACSATAGAQDQGTWQWRAGAHWLTPKSDNHPLVNVDDATMMTFDVTYLPIQNFGLELLAALPFTHAIALNSGEKVGEVTQLPPTMTFQYRLFPDARIRPYLGLGVNYTLLFDEDTSGALRGTKLQLKDSFGTTFQVGVDVSLGSAWFLNLDARWLEIESRAELGGVDIGTIEIDPYAVGISIGRSF